MSKCPEDYSWSSYSHYVGEKAPLTGCIERKSLVILMETNSAIEDLWKTA